MNAPVPRPTSLCVVRGTEQGDPRSTQGGGDGVKEVGFIGTGVND
jgi:hypothetical protein